METTRAPAVGSWSELGSCLQNRMKDGDGKSLKERAQRWSDSVIPADRTVLQDRNEKRKINLPNSDAMLSLKLRAILGPVRKGSISSSPLQCGETVG